MPPVREPKKKRRTGLIILVVILVVAILIGTYFLIKTPPLEEIIAKEDSLTGKNTMALMATNDEAGMDRAGLTEKEVKLIVALIESANIEGLIEAGVTPEEIQAVMESGLVDMEKAEAALEKKVQDTIDEGIRQLELAEENR